MTAIVIPKIDMASQVGRKLEPSPWVTLDQGRINTFADCTEDHQFIHVDLEAAAKTPFGGTIAHGFLTLSMLTKLCEDTMILPEGTVMALNYGCDKVRFLNPVRAGKRIRALTEVAHVDQKDDNRFLIKNMITIEIEGEDTPAAIVEWLTMAITG
jgi:acyl dehydratase